MNDMYEKKFNTSESKARSSGLDDHPDAVTHFISCVKKRPPLYNYKLPQHERRRTDVARIWEELADEIGNVSATECRKKWKNLRDTFHQYRLRKMKFKDLLEKWRYSTDLAFLTDIYQPKLKCQRAGYLNKSHEKKYKFNEVDPSSLSAKIEVVDDSHDDKDFSANEDTIIEDGFDESIQHVIEMDEVQFCDVEAMDGNIKTINLPEDSYDEVHLYDEVDNNLIEYDALEATNETVSKQENTEQCSSMTADASVSFTQNSKSQNLIIGDNKNELDLFFQFLKTKIQKLPSVDITAIQIEFLNAVLKREAANVRKTMHGKSTGSS